jgi:hypothetical protein
LIVASEAPEVESHSHHAAIAAAPFGFGSLDPAMFAAGGRQLRVLLRKAEDVAN